MILTPHSIVGAVIVNMFPSHPAIGFGLAFASHYALDLIPHYDYDLDGFIDSEKKTVQSIFHEAKARLRVLLVGCDFLFALVVCFFIFVRDEKSLYLTLLGVVAGVLPDVFQFFYLKWKREPWIFFQNIHDAIHHPDKMKDRPVLGFLYQLLVIVFFLALYFLFTK
jgi:hypothetical protein